MEPCPSIPSVPNRVHPWIQTHVHPSTHTNCHLLPCAPWFNPPPNPIPLNPCPSVPIRGEKTPRPLPSFSCDSCLPWFQQHPHPSVVIGVHPWFENDHRIKPAQMELRPPQKTAPHSVSSVVPKTPGNCAEDTDFRDFPVRSSSAAAEFFPFRAVPNCENRRVRQGDT